MWCWGRCFGDPSLEGSAWDWREGGIVELFFRGEGVYGCDEVWRASGDGFVLCALCALFRRLLWGLEKETSEI